MARSSGQRVDVLIVDDHPMWRRMLRQVLDASPRHEVVAEAADGEEAMRIALDLQPHVVIMDLNLPGIDGTTATRQLADALPETKVMVLSASDERAHVVAAMQAGASGYLLKTAEPGDVIDAITRVHDGELVVPKEVADAVVSQLRGEPQARRAPRREALDVLTPREREVLGLMAEGRSNQGISDLLTISLRAVEGHVRNIFMKLGLEPAPDDHRRVLAVLTHLRAEPPD